MKVLIRIALYVLMLISVEHVLAQTEEHELGVQLLKAMAVDKNIKKTKEMMMKDAQNAGLGNQMVRAIKEHFNYQDIETEMAAVYATHFTKDELKRAIILFNDPVFLKWNKVHFQLTRDIQSIIMPRMQIIADQVGLDYPK